MSANNPLSTIPPLGAPTGTMPNAGASKFKQVDPIRVVRTYLLLLVAAVFVGAVLGTGSWFVLNKYVARYTSEATLTVSTGMTDPNNPISTTTDTMKDLEPKILTQVAVIRSQEILDLLLKQPEVRATEWYQQFDGNLEDAREDLELYVLRANHMRDTTLIKVSATTANPTDAQTLVRGLNAVYLDKIESTAESQYNTDRIAFQRQYEADLARIETVNAQIRRHLLDHPRASTTERFDVVTQELLSLNSTKSEFTEFLTTAQANVAQLQKRLDDGDFAPADDEVAQIEASLAIQQFDSQLSQLRTSRNVQLDHGLGESHHLIKQIDSQILHVEREREIEFDKQARTIFNARIETANNAVSIYEEQIRAIEPRIAELSAKQEDLQRALNEYMTLQRELESLEEQRDDSRERLAALDTVISRDGNITVRPNSPATTAEQSFPPKWYIMIPGVTVLFFGLVLGLVFLRELLDQRVRAAADIKALTDTTLLGIVPDAGEDPSGKAPVERIVERQPTGLLAESFRQVRSAVLSKMDRRGYKTLAVAAAKPKAGTSTVVQNLGASMAMSGRRVLIIDANFRRPNQCGLAEVAPGTGLVDVLSGRVDAADVADHIHTCGGLSLSVLTTGDAEGAAPELLESPAFRDLLAQLESSYDIILIDTPPSLLTSEAQHMCKYVDAMVLVARARTDTRGMLQRLVGQLDGQRADILGVVLNGVQAAAGGYLRQNFQEFDRYRNPASGSRKPRPAAKAPAPTASNGAPATAERTQTPSSEETVIVDALQDLDELDDMDDFDADRD